VLLFRFETLLGEGQFFAAEEGDGGFEGGVYLAGLKRMLKKSSYKPKRTSAAKAALQMHDLRHG
jgi:hypothetical protein